MHFNFFDFLTLIITFFTINYRRLLSLYTFLNWNSHSMYITNKIINTRKENI